MVQLVVDGVVYGLQRYGGVNAMFSAVLPRLASTHNVPIKLLLPRRVLADVPNGPIAHCRRELLPEKTGWSWTLDRWIYGPASGWMNSLVRDFQVGTGRDTVYQSTYFTWTHRRVPQVATVYDLNHELFPELFTDGFGQWLRRQYRRYLARATRIVAISEKTKRDVQTFYGIAGDRIDVAHLAVDRTQFYPEPVEQTPPAGLPPDWIGRYLLYVGGRQDYKNFEVLLDALTMLSACDCPGLVVAGRPWTPAESERISALEISERIRHIPTPGDEELRRLYSASRAFVYPSLHEGFGVPLLEAMACGTPVLAADTEIFREVAGDAALFFEPTSAEALASQALGLTEPTQRNPWIERGHRRLENFSWDRCAAVLYQSYTRALEEGPRG